MSISISRVEVASILTRTGGYLRDVASHSLQPYRGCSFGNSLCGVGCYVRHNAWVTRGREWGSFLEVRTNAADVYRRSYRREAAWARRTHGAFSIFCSSATDPFVPQERTYGVTAALLTAMAELPPDRLILQTHTHLVAEQAAAMLAVAGRCHLRLHVSIESDRDQLPGLPPSASPVAKRLDACRQLRGLGVFTVVTVAPLLPIAAPQQFFERIAESADAVVIDHYIGGDGSHGGDRTLRTPLPAAIAELDPAATSLKYRDRIVEIARRAMPGRVGVSAAGFAGVYA
jgi:DNA repair photolyase